MVLRARAGDDGGVDELVAVCTPLMRSVARRYLADPAEVDDVVQEVWLKFLLNLDRIHEPAATRAWLLRVLTHAAWRARSRAGRAVPTPDIDDGTADDDTEASALRRVGREDARRRLCTALGGLRPADRRLVLLLADDRKPDYRTIGRTVGRPVGSIGPTRQRALAQLRRDPALAGVTPS